MECVQGQADKGAALAALLAERGIAPAAVAYVGNDVNDLECLRLVGVPIVVADATPAARAEACIQQHHILSQSSRWARTKPSSFRCG